MTTAATGRSGAVVRVRGSVAVKAALLGTSAATRVIAQGQYMRDTGSHVFPHVTAIGRERAIGLVGETGYEMESLLPIDPAVLATTRGFQQVVQALRRLWFASTHRVVFDEDAHIAKVERLALEYLDASPLEVDALTTFALNMVRNEVTTHGDPTLANVMTRGSDIVLIDPLPPTPTEPSARCVDLGKLLQSAWGYEHLVFGWPRVRAESHAEHLILSVALSDGERLSARYWGVVHLLRCLPYANDSHEAEKLARLAHDKLRALINDTHWF